ncbi:MAG: hypothetical protein PHS57_01160 [Alphaproteobacteria bacterium]|nr:hypothetical protein [Alphaproteobacteria bacterium]
MSFFKYDDNDDKASAIEAEILRKKGENKRIEDETRPLLIQALDQASEEVFGEKSCFVVDAVNVEPELDSPIGAAFAFSVKAYEHPFASGGARGPLCVLPVGQLLVWSRDRAAQEYGAGFCLFNQETPQGEPHFLPCSSFSIQGQDEAARRESFNTILPEQAKRALRTWAKNTLG